MDILIAHPPAGSIQDLKESELVGLDLSLFSHFRMRLLKEVGDEVLIGEPIVEDKDFGGRVFISCASGVIKKIVRGEKRRIQTIVIERKKEDRFYEGEKIAYESLSKEEIVNKLHKNGLLSHIRSRPFDRMARPDKLPKSIFIKGLESAPFTPSASMQLKGSESLFQEGIHLLSKVAPLHLVVDEKDSSFHQIESAMVHTASGPHPIANPSLHIYQLDPITNPHEVVWTLSVLDVITIGKWAKEGVYHIDRIVALAGPGVLEEKAGYYRSKMGCSIDNLIKDRVEGVDLRFISGDPLMGTQVGVDGFLGFSHTCVSVFAENRKREPFHFFRLGLKKYTQTKTYLSGFLKKKPYPFTTNQHGEGRPFVDGQIYEKVMPMRIPTMQLMKSLIAEDYDTAVELGLLEVVPEDFALPTFLCPSKINMVQIVLKGLKKYSEESAL